MNGEEKKKLLFLHNTLPEFRVCFFEELSQQINTRFVITHPEMASKVYGVDGRAHNTLVVHYLTGGLRERICAIKREVADPEIHYIILPPADSISEILEGNAALITAKRYHKKVFTWTEKWEAPKCEQSMIKKSKNFIHKLILRRYANSACRCIVFGSQAKKYIQSIGISEDKIRVSYMTSLPPRSKDKINIRQKYKIPKNKKLIFNLARMIPRKGLDILIEAIVILNGKYKDITLLIGGDGPMRPAIEKKIKELNLSNVILAGYVDPELRTEYYKQADLFVLPSKYFQGMIDGWGLPVNESLFCETPVVATTCEGSAYDLLDGKNGIMVEQNNPQALAEGIEKILYRTNQEECLESCRSANERFSLGAMTREFVKAIMESYQ